MSLLYGQTKDSLQNRKNFLSELGIDYRNLICAKQIHSGNVGYVQEIDKGRGALKYEDSIADTDAFVTDKKNLPIAIFTADCLSVFLYDPKAPAIGLAHAGWRSTKENIAVKTAHLMRERFNTKPDNLYVAFGPSIRECCYEAGEEFKEFFPNDLIRKNDCFYLGLVKLNKAGLLSFGAKEKNIFDSGQCTFCQSGKFFSFRREGTSCGRMMSVMMLK